MKLTEGPADSAQQGQNNTKLRQSYGLPFMLYSVFLQIFQQKLSVFL